MIHKNWWVHWMGQKDLLQDKTFKNLLEKSYVLYVAFFLLKFINAKG